MKALIGVMMLAGLAASGCYEFMFFGFIVIMLLVVCA